MALKTHSLVLYLAGLIVFLAAAVPALLVGLLTLTPVQAAADEPFWTSQVTDSPETSKAVGRANEEVQRVVTVVDSSSKLPQVVVPYLPEGARYRLVATAGICRFNEGDRGKHLKTLQQVTAAVASITPSGTLREVLAITARALGFLRRIWNAIRKLDPKYRNALGLDGAGKVMVKEGGVVLMGVTGLPEWGHYEKAKDFRNALRNEQEKRKGKIPACSNPAHPLCHDGQWYRVTRPGALSVIAHDGAHGDNEGAFVTVLEFVAPKGGR